MRGKRVRGHDQAGHGRIIPARAGQTVWACRSSIRRPDHPRACGANLPILSATAPNTGSSPRVRGKLPARPIPLDARRIIPARAGQTSVMGPPRPPSTDHPRACGANRYEARITEDGDGSSPRVRGKQLPHGVAPLEGRIIPARAGQTHRRKGSRCGAPDHPRACGANTLKAAQAQLGTGSSPSVRGKLALPDRHPREGRIIPARAGQT